MKIQFGAGGNRLEGWRNHDMDVNLEKLPLPYGNEVADMVFMEHCLEHFTVKQALAILDDIYRILKHGGRLRICCPILERLDVPAGRDIALNHGHLMIFSQQSLKDFIRLAGFTGIHSTGRSELDGHARVIGVEKDDRETARVEAFKP